MLDLGRLRDPDDFSRRLAVTVTLLVAYRLGAHIPLPGLNARALAQLDVGVWERLSIVALGITPFITILILTELIKVIAPRLHRWEQADERNRYRLGRIVVGLSLLAAAVQAAGIALGLEGVTGLVDEPGTPFRLMTMATLVGGTAIVIWLADQITRHGLGSGVWLVLLTGWFTTLPFGSAGTEWLGLFDGLTAGTIIGWGVAAVLLAAVVALILAGGRTRETAATCLWSKLLAGTVWPWLIIVIGLILGGGSLENADRWLAPGLPLYLLQVLALAALVAVFAHLYIRAQRIAGATQASHLPPAVLAGGLAAIAFADMASARLLPSGALSFVGRHILVAVVMTSILARWWQPPFEAREKTV